MTLDIETPDPPMLSGAQDPGDYDAVDEPEDAGDDYRREALAAFLEWGVSRRLRRLGRPHLPDGGRAPGRPQRGLRRRVRPLLEPLSAEDVGYRAPTVPTDLPASPDLNRDDIRGNEEELDDLGRTVSEVLENDYVERSSEEFGYDWE